MSAAITLTLLSIVTFTVTPVSGTAWFWLSNAINQPEIGALIHLALIAIGFIGGMYEFSKENKGHC